MKKWYNVELKGQETKRFRGFLLDMHYRFETSGAYEYTHFEIWVTEDDARKCNDFLASL